MQKLDSSPLLICHCCKNDPIHHPVIASAKTLRLVPAKHGAGHRGRTTSDANLLTSVTLHPWKHFLIACASNSVGLCAYIHKPRRNVKIICLTRRHMRSCLALRGALNTSYGFDVRVNSTHVHHTTCTRKHPKISGGCIPMAVM